MIRSDKKTEKAVEHEDGGDIKCSWSPWNSR